MVTIPENLGFEDMDALGDVGVLEYLGKKKKKKGLLYMMAWVIPPVGIALALSKGLKKKKRKRKLPSGKVVEETVYVESKPPKPGAPPPVPGAKPAAPYVEEGPEGAEEEGPEEGAPPSKGMPAPAEAPAEAPMVAPTLTEGGPPWPLIIGGLVVVGIAAFLILRKK